jgi:hypothetical protein
MSSDGSHAHLEGFGHNLLRALPRVEPPASLLPRILAALDDRAALAEAPRPAPRWVTWAAATAAMLTLSVGLLGVARAASRAAAVPARTLAAGRPLSVVDDPDLVFPGPGAFDPLRGLGRVEPGDAP